MNGSGASRQVPLYIYKMAGIHIYNEYDPRADRLDMSLPLNHRTGRRAL